MKMRITAPGVAAGALFVMLTGAGAWAADSKDTAPPPVSAEPQNTSATYGDWTLRCSRAGEGGQAARVCEVGLAFQVQGQQGPFAQLAIGRVSAKDPWKATLVAVPNIGFPSSVKLSLDDKDTQPIDLNWRYCIPGGCRAEADLKDDDLKRWKAQTGPARMQFKDSTGREITAPVSLRGFPQALEALAKS
jgi:invasion protein IalB